MIEFLFQLIAEFLLQVVGEAIVELGLHSLQAPFRRKPNPWLAAIGYTLLGAIIGTISLLIFSSHLVAAEIRTTNLVVTPILAGLAMSLLGAWRTRRGQTLQRIDRFSYGYLFALSFALVRYFFAH